MSNETNQLLSSLASMQAQAPMTIDTISLEGLGAYLLFDEINSYVAKEVCEFILKANLVQENEIILFVNSPGGICSDGFAIIDFMEASRIPVATRAIGAIESMGVTIFVSGYKGMRTMAPNTVVMTHQFFGGSAGKAHELMAIGDHYKQLHEQFVHHFVKHTNMNEKQVRDILLGPSDKYLEPKECLKYGLCDRVTTPWEFEDKYAKAAKPARSRRKDK